MVGTVTFNQAMLAKDRVFAIRAGAYTSSDIKEASFNYGYISGDTFKPGGTVAGSAKLIFTSIITTFNKLDKIYPEIGLLVGDSYEWVAMGEYFVNDISIDRNRNTTELDLMDGMFKLNQPYISDLTYPAQIRDVIREICVKTGIELETDNLGLKAIQRHIEVKADKKDITFREVLSQAIQLLGFSAFFNRKGKLEVRGLTESRITVTADNYFLHGLTKSEIQYQIAGITCKKDKETLTVGLRTGRSLELENSFMNQNLLDELYYELKDIKYYPFSLDWQGHLKLDVGQWVTLKTNKNETYKVPVLSQSFSFKGGLKSKISADSKAGNDTQYSYKGFLTKQIEQMSTQIDAEIQQQLEYANAEFDRKTEEYKKELDDGIEKSKAEAEAYADTIKQEIDTEIAQVNQSMQAQSEEHDRQVADILAKTQSVESLANQAKTDAAGAITQALQSKDEAIADARAQVATVSQALNTAKTDLQNLATYQETVDRKLTELTSNTRTLDGKIDAASAKVDTVAGQIRTELTRVEGKIPSDLGGRNYILKSDVYATSGSRYFDTSPEFIDYAYSGKYVTISLDIKGENLVPDSRGLSRIGCELRLNLSDGKVLYLQCQKIVSGTQPRERISVTRKIPEGVSVVSANKVNMYVQVGGTALAGRPKFELSSIPSDWSPAPEDINSELSSTKTLITQTAEGQTQLSNRLTTTQDKVSTAEAKISQLISDVSSKVSQTDYNTLTGRVSSAETAITQNANEIGKRLTSTQVESAITGKGYQTKSDVDSNITGRGYITSSALQPYALSTTVQNLVKETSDSFSRTISETKALIPTEVGGRNYFSKYLSNYNTVGTYAYRELGINPITITVSDNDVNQDVNGCFIGVTKNGYDASDGYYWIVKNGYLETNKTTINGFGFLSIYPKTQGTIDKLFKRYNIKVELGAIPTDWSPAPEDLATVTALHAVNDTVDSHTRTIGAVGTAGSILDNVSKVTQTAAGLVQEVSGTNGLKTQVSTLAGSWAVKNLNSDGDILSQANLSPDSFLLEAAKIRLKGKTLADEIQAIDGKFNTLFVSDGTFGKLDAKIIGAQAITGDQIKFDKGFFDALAANRLLVKDFFAKDAVVTSIQAVTLSATQIKSGVLKAFNDRTTLDLSTGKLTFNDGSPSIEFNSDASAIRRVTNGQSQFIKFASYLLGTQTTIGANRKANDESIGTADFTGIQIQSRAGGVLSLIDKVYVCADEFVVDGGGGQVDGFVFKNREALYPQSSGMLNLGRLGNRWNNVYAFDYYVGRNAVDLRAFLDAVRACFHQIAYGGMTQTTYDLIKNNLTNTFNKIQ